MTRFPLTDQQILCLVKRMNLSSKIMQRYIEEQIIQIVNLSEAWHSNALEQFLKSKKIIDADLSNWLEQRSWDKEDLQIHLAREESLYRFSKQRFGPGLEERYLSSAANLDSVIYSVVRLRNKMLARELWFRLSEGEISFIKVAEQYGEGPEAKRKGLIGPIPIGTLEPPRIRDLLRGLSPGEFTYPEQFGEWFLLLQLEELNQSVLDDTMRKTLLNEQLETFLQERTQALLSNKQVEPLHYDSEP